MPGSDKKALAQARLDDIEAMIIAQGDDFITGPMGFAVTMLLKSGRKDPVRFMEQAKGLADLLVRLTEGF